MKVVLDIEADGLLDTVSRIWCAVCKDIETGDVYAFTPEDIDNGKLKAFCQSVDLVIGHNIIDYDLPVLARLAGIQFPDKCVIDTLILSRLHWQARPDGHSLEAWGQRLNSHKIEFDDWSRYTEEMLTYCIQDVELNYLVYKYLKQEMPEDVWKDSIQLETDMAFICRDMHNNGFTFDYARARDLEIKLTNDLLGLDRSISGAFPPRLRPVREVCPRLTKHGTISRSNIPRDFGSDFSGLSEGSSFIERLNEFGWKPVDKTKGHQEAEKAKDHDRLKKFKQYGWQLNERNLATLPDTAPEAARLLVKRGLIAARLRTLTEWFGSYNPHTGRVHGTFDTLGTWTHRLSHRKPNLGNIAAKKSIKYNTPELKKLATELGGIMRGFWTCEEDEWLVSCDMAAAHMRIFAHLVQDQTLIDLIEADGDIHTMNMEKFGGLCPDRDRAKTFIYTFFNGGAVPKVASIFGCSQEQARVGFDLFVANYPLLQTYKKETFPSWAERGYFIGLDGRKVACDSAHQMMAGILQNYEAVLMKQANVMWRKIADEKGYRYRQVNLVHDEYVTAVKGSRQDAEAVGSIQAQCLEQVGLNNKLLCPIKGSFKVGRNWLEIH